MDAKAFLLSLTWHYRIDQNARCMYVCVFAHVYVFKVLVGCWYECLTRAQKVVSSNSCQQERQENFSSPDLTLCADSYLVSAPPPCYRSGTKIPLSFCQKCRRQVAHAPLTQQSQSWLTLPLSRHSVGTVQN